MRIIAGKFRSRIIRQVSLPTTRETADKVRQAIFNSLGNAVLDATVLDLFSGSGALALEAISRGAKRADCVDIEPLAIKTIRDNATTLGILEQVYIHLSDYQQFLSKNNQQYDLIFLDPPYNFQVMDRIIFDILEKKILKNNAFIICEVEKDYIFSYNRLIVKKEQSYGYRKIIILQNKMDNQ